GVVSTSGYKGVFANIDEVNAAGKAISYLPARDGKVYEIRDNALGRFITPVAGCDLLSDVRAGYTPALGIPRIPMDLIMRIIAFFRYLTFNGAGKEPKEALVNIYWDSQHKVFVVDTPEQIVSNVSVHSNENLDFLNERYIHYMDIHSHNTMRAYFSETDNADEKATRLYTVIGCLDKFFPEIKTRISNGGKFHEIEPSEVFEFIARTFPEEWKEKVNFRKAHKDEGVNPDDRDMSRHGFGVNKGRFPWDDECCEKCIKGSYGYGVGDGS
ncbi:MAG: Mov34/MPN/PAD-1 family protein, partial [Defluviitaleaceae bacterium]|nr:Mov34/MPN/PAD-1 family protein [Defluviitaleaceae bacterium]